MKRYFSLYQEEKQADIYIYGDITLWDWYEGDTSSYTLSKTLEELDEDIETINIYINSYGGHVSEGLAIYNALKRHPARVKTIVDGFACSIASVVFAAGDERLMSDTSLLMIHNAWTYAAGDANDLRKEADDLETVTQASINAYMKILNIEEAELKSMMDAETWIIGDEALDIGFVTELIEDTEDDTPTQGIRKSLIKQVIKKPEVVAKVKLDEDKLREIVAETIEQFYKEEIQEVDEVIYRDGNGKVIEVMEKELENKPVNMFKALFNFKEE